MLYRDRVVEKDIEKNEKKCETLEVKQDLFCDEELAIVLKELKNNKAPDVDSVANEVFMVALMSKISYWGTRI